MLGRVRCQTKGYEKLKERVIFGRSNKVEVRGGECVQCHTVCLFLSKQNPTVPLSVLVTCTHIPSLRSFLTSAALLNSSDHLVKASYCNHSRLVISLLPQEQRIPGEHQIPQSGVCVCVCNYFL